MIYEFSEDVRAFLQEKKYLQNVSPQTIVLYETSFKKFYRCDTIEAVKQRVCELREAGRDNPVSVNTYLRHMKTYFIWKGLKWNLPWLKEEEKILQTLSTDGITSLIRWKGVGVNLKRAHLVALTILDTGLRASEVLSLRISNVDLDNMTLAVHGKGNKHRLVPFSLELRKQLYKSFFGRSDRKQDWIFATRNGTPISVRNLERDIAALGRRLGIINLRFSPHTLRHTFACSWLKNGGDLYQLSRILGHSSISTTTIYLRSLGIDTLQASHCRYSPLSALHHNGR